MLLSVISSSVALTSSPSLNSSIEASSLKSNTSFCSASNVSGKIISAGSITSSLLNGSGSSIANGASEISSVSRDIGSSASSLISLLSSAKFILKSSGIVSVKLPKSILLSIFWTSEGELVVTVSSASSVSACSKSNDATS